MGSLPPLGLRKTKCISSKISIAFCVCFKFRCRNVGWHKLLQIYWNILHSARRPSLGLESTTLNYLKVFKSFVLNQLQQCHFAPYQLNKLDSRCSSLPPVLIPITQAKQLPTGLKSSLLCPSVPTHCRDNTSTYWSILQPRSALQIHLSQYLFTTFTSGNFRGFLRQTGQYSTQVITCLYFTKMGWNRKKKTYISYIHKKYILKKQSSTQVYDETESPTWSFRYS